MNLAALFASIPVQGADRTWHNVILPALEGPGNTQQRVDCEAAMAPAYPLSPASGAEPPFAVTRKTPRQDSATHSGVVLAAVGAN